MRVIAGSAKGRRLKGVRGTAVRPTADRVREALFSILLSRFSLEGTSLLDLYAGTGALGIEALSRGARHVVFVEHHRPMTRVLEANLTACGFRDRAEVRCATVERALPAMEGVRRFDGVLLDPPYGRGLAVRALARIGAGTLLEPAAWAAVEHSVNDALDDAYGVLRLTHRRSYGKTSLTLYATVSAVEW